MPCNNAKKTSSCAFPLFAITFKINLCMSEIPFVYMYNPIIIFILTTRDGRINYESPQMFFRNEMMRMR